MEDVLDVYQQPYDPLRPVVCLDETNQQLVEKQRIPAKPGSVEREDYEYRRCGVVDLFVAFEPAQARRIIQRLEIHYTPIHASWLNMAEIEIGILSRQCLSQALSSFETMQRQVNAWAMYRNSVCSTVRWRFSSDDARCKLRKLYPIIL